LQLGRPTEAAAVLRRARAELSRSSQGAALYVRALCACGAEPLAQDFLDELARAPAPAALLSAARALLEAGAFAAAGRWARRVLGQDAGNQAARLLEADSLRLRAAAGDGPWDARLAHEAVSAYERVLLHEPGNLVAAMHVVRLHLEGLNDPRAAARAAAR